MQQSTNSQQQQSNYSTLIKYRKLLPASGFEQLSHITTHTVYRGSTSIKGCGFMSVLAQLGFKIGPHNGLTGYAYNEEILVGYCEGDVDICIPSEDHPLTAIIDEHHQHILTQI